MISTTWLAQTVADRAAWIRVAGMCCGIPITLEVLDGKELPLLHVALISILVAARLWPDLRSVVVTMRASPLGRMVFFFAAWLTFSTIAATVLIYMGTGWETLGARAASVGALVFFMALPGLFGLLYLRNALDFHLFFDGVIVGVLITVTALLTYFVWTAFTDITQLRYVFGQRVPLLFIFIGPLLMLRAKGGLPTYTALIALLLCGIFLADVRAVAFMFFAALPLMVFLLWGYGANRVLPMLAVVVFAWLLAAQFTQINGRFLALDNGTQGQLQTLNVANHAVLYSIDPKLAAAMEEILFAFRNAVEADCEAQTKGKRPQIGHQLGSEPVPCTGTGDCRMASPADDDLQRCNAQRQHVLDVAYLKYLAAIHAPLTMWAYEKGMREESLMVRLLIWDILATKVFRNIQTAVLGYGQLGPSYVGDPIVSPHGVFITRYSAHNEYMDALTRSGLVGVGLYLVLYLTLLYSMVMYVWRGETLGATMLALAIGLVMAAGYGMLHETTRYPPFAILFWVLVGAVCRLEAARMAGGERSAVFPRVAPASRPV